MSDSVRGGPAEQATPSESRPNRGTPSLGLALGGGAARGLAHIVVLEALDEMGVTPGFIAGCSIGALIGAAYASGLSGREIRDHALEVLGSPGAAARRLFWPGRSEKARALNLGLLRPVSLNGLGLVRLVSPPGMAARVEETKIPFVVNSTDFYSGREVTIDQGEMEAAIAASIAIPGVIEAPRHEGRVVIDGAYVNPVPMWQVRKAGCALLVAVDVVGMPQEEGAGGKGPGAAELVVGSTQILQKEIVRLKAAEARPEVMLTPAIDRFGAHEFLKIREILAAAEPERERLKRLLGPLLERGGAASGEGGGADAD